MGELERLGGADEFSRVVLELLASASDELSVQARPDGEPGVLVRLRVGGETIEAVGASAADCLPELNAARQAAGLRQLRLAV